MERVGDRGIPGGAVADRGTAERDAGLKNCIIEERRATGVLAIGRPVATAPQVHIPLGAGPIAVLPIASRSPM